MVVIKGLGSRFLVLPLYFSYFPGLRTSGIACLVHNVALALTSLVRSEACIHAAHCGSAADRCC